jgi:multidrug efflux pump subunit AcrB
MMPPGVRHEFGGLYQHQQIGFAGLAKEFAAALIAELILLVFLDERLWLPLPLLSTTAVFTVFWLTGVELNITALTAMTMIIGISAEMAIFYVSEFTELAQRMPAHDALRGPVAADHDDDARGHLHLVALGLAFGPGSSIQ